MQDAYPGGPGFNVLFIFKLKAMELSCRSWVSSRQHRPASCLLPPAIKRPVRRRYAMTMQTKLILMSTASNATMKSSSFVQLYQKKRQKRNSTMMAPIPATGPYCFRSNSQLMRTAARLYFAESSRRRLLMSPILSKLSPR